MHRDEHPVFYFDLLLNDIGKYIHNKKSGNLVLNSFRNLKLLSVYHCDALNTKIFSTK